MFFKTKDEKKQIRREKNLVYGKKLIKVYYPELLNLTSEEQDQILLNMKTHDWNKDMFEAYTDKGFLLLRRYKVKLYTDYNILYVSRSEIYTNESKIDGIKDRKQIGYKYTLHFGVMFEEISFNSEEEVCNFIFKND